MNIEVFVADEQVDHPIDTDRWLRLAVQVLAAEGVDRNNEGVEMSLLFVDEPSISELNLQFMGKTGPTDVLSFPIDEEASPRHIPPLAIAAPVGMPLPARSDDEDDEELPLLLGDVVVCPSYAATNAPEHASDHHDGTLADEIALLVVHGILHLLGMDHMDDTEAELMEAREQELLSQFHRVSSPVQS